MSILNNRFTTVAAGAAIVVGLGATGAVAADRITSKDIENNSVRSVDVEDDGLTGRDIKNGGLRLADLAPNALEELTETPEIPEVPEGITGLEADSLAAPTPIAMIGGPINANNTDLETGLTLPAGRYLVTVDGAFMSDTAAADPSVDVYPQLSLWIDRSGDDAFQWQQDEGDISPNALMPTAADRHIAVSGSSVVELTEETYVGLLAFGYDSLQGSARSGEIDVISATITATPLP